MNSATTSPVKYTGECPESWLVFVRWRVAILVKEGDVLLADVGNEIHSNTEIVIHSGYGATSGRLATDEFWIPLDTQILGEQDFSDASPFRSDARLVSPSAVFGSAKLRIKR